MGTKLRAIERIRSPPRRIQVPRITEMMQLTGDDLRHDIHTPMAHLRTPPLLFIYLSI